MIKLENHNLYAIGGLMNMLIDDMNIKDRSSTQYIMGNMSKHITIGNGGVFVDNLEDPTCLIWYVINQSALLNQKMFQIPLFFVREDKRGNKDVLKEMLDIVEKGKEANKCDIVTGASWNHGKSAKNSSNMWELQGYQQMEIVYEK